MLVYQLFEQTQLLLRNYTVAGCFDPKVFISCVQDVECDEMAFCNVMVSHTCKRYGLVVLPICLHLCWQGMPIDS